MIFHKIISQSLFVYYAGNTNALQFYAFTFNHFADAFIQSDLQLGNT